MVIVRYNDELDLTALERTKNADVGLKRSRVFLGWQFKFHAKAMLINESRITTKLLLYGADLSHRNRRGVVGNMQSDCLFASNPLSTAIHLK